MSPQEGTKCPPLYMSYKEIQTRFAQFFFLDRGAKHVNCQRGDRKDTKGDDADPGRARLTSPLRSRRVLCRGAVCEGTKGQKRPRDFCVLFPYLSLFCLSGALACYLSLFGLSVVAHAARRKSICGACVFAGIGDRT